MHKHKLITVTWGDAWGNAGWSRSVNMEPVMVESTGYLLHRNKKGILLAQGISEDDGAALGVGFIPKGMIKKVKVLR